MKTRTHTIRMLATAVFAAASIMVSAQTDSTANNAKMITGTSMFSYGWTDILDTYLSQEKFTGKEVRYLSQSFRRRENHRLYNEVSHQIIISSAGTRGNTNSLLTALYNVKLGKFYGWEFNDIRLKLFAGGLADGTLGGTYNTRNSNNPAQARISLSIDPAAKLMWDFQIRQRPFKLHYEIGVPLVGMAFSPNYGQSYYEIFSKGNYNNNIVFTSPFNAPQLHQSLLLDFKLWRTVFTIGYMTDIRQMKVNNLKYHQYSHGVVLGTRF